MIPHAKTHGVAIEIAADATFALAPSILLVDDRVANLVALEAVLEPLGLRLVRAESGTHALRCLLQHEFAAVILDVQMPDLDGFETAKRIRERPRTREMPILFVTAGESDEASRARGYSLGAVDYLTKPFDPSVLRARVSAFAKLWLQAEARRREVDSLHAAERSRLRREVSHREQQLSSIIDGVRDHAIMMLDAEGNILTINAPAERITGFPLAEVSGKFFGLFFDEGDRTSRRPETELASARSAGTYRGEAIRRRRDGRSFHAQVTLSALRDDAGSVCGFVEVIYDITAQVLARQEAERLAEVLRESETRLREVAEVAERERARAEVANRTKDLFLSTLSHELRTPLNAILGWTQMLRTGGIDASRTERALEVIGRNARAQLALVEDMLDVSRINAGTLRLRVGPCDLLPLLEAAVDAALPTAASKDVTIETTLGGVVTVVADEARVQQIVGNLLSNAIKFTPSGGTVTLRMRDAGAVVEILVSDTGQGIATEFLPHVFDAFSQEGDGPTRRHGGLGLGLSIVKRLVELHGGAISVASDGPGLGAEFKVSLPTTSTRANKRAASIR